MGRGGKFKTQKSKTVVQENRSRQVKSLCSRTSGRVPERNRAEIWLCAVSSTQGAQTTAYYAKKKTVTYEEKDYDKIAEYKYEIADIPPETIAYVDETGIDSYYYREYGYSPEGQPVHGRIRGRKYARTGIVAAQMGDAMARQKILCKSRNASVVSRQRIRSKYCLNPSGTEFVLTRLTYLCSGMRDGMHAQRECRLSSRKC